MKNTYSTQYILQWVYGNNIFAYTHRCEKPSLYIPSMIQWGIHDLHIGTDIVFAEIENDILRECIWLQNFVHTTWHDIPVYIVDNHNHALYMWADALVHGYVQHGFTLVHIDEHSDMWQNEYTEEFKNIYTPESIYTADFLQNIHTYTNYKCNVGNYIQPAIYAKMISEMICIENEYQIDMYREYMPNNNMVLNLDIDFFSPDMDYIDYQKKKDIVLHFARKAKCITVATSPFFIDQHRAIQTIHDIFGEKE